MRDHQFTFDFEMHFESIINTILCTIKLLPITETLKLQSILYILPMPLHNLIMLLLVFRVSHQLPKSNGNHRSNNNPLKCIISPKFHHFSKIFEDEISPIKHLRCSIIFKLIISNFLIIPFHFSMYSLLI